MRRLIHASRAWSTVARRAGLTDDEATGSGFGSAPEGACPARGSRLVIWVLASESSATARHRQWAPQGPTACCPVSLRFGGLLSYSCLRGARVNQRDRSMLGKRKN